MAKKNTGATQKGARRTATRSVRGKGAPALAAWPSVPLEELVAQQGVSPAENLEEIGALWPVDDDPEELLAHILRERAARRNLFRAEG